MSTVRVETAERWWHPAEGWPSCPTCKQDYPRSRGRVEHWVEATVEDGWCASLRLGVQDGHPVVTELRVFPDHSGRRLPGRWGVDELDDEAASRVVPRGGLMTRTVRRIKVPEMLRESIPQLIRWTEGMRAAYVGPEPASADDLPLVAAGIKDATFVGVKRHRARGRSDEELTHIAALYVELAQHPEKARRIAQAVGDALVPPESSARARQLIHAARSRGLLSAVPKSGVSGGYLTAKAKHLLNTTRQVEPEEER